MRRSRLIFLTLLISLMAFAAACGGSDDSTDEAVPPVTEATTAAAEEEAEAVPASDWANSVCTSVSDWQQEIQSGTPDFSNVTDAEEAKQTIADYLESVATATRAMIDQVRAAGTPDVEAGETIAEDFQNALAPVADSFDQARADVEALPTDDPTAFASEVSAIGTTLSEAGTQAGTAFDELAAKYPDAGLDAASGDAPACADLGG